MEDLYDGASDDEYEEFLEEQADFDALVESEEITRITFEEVKDV